MGFSPYILLQKYIILLLGQYRQKFYPYFGKFCRRSLVVWIGHQQKTIPALRSEEQVPALGVPPGVRRCRQHTPPTLCLFLFHTELRAVRTVKACEGYCKWCTSSKYSQTFDCVRQVALLLRRKPFICVLQRFAEGLGHGLEHGFGQGVLWFAYLPTILVC